MKNSVKLLLLATAACVLIYMGVYIGRNFYGPTITVQSDTGNHIDLDQKPESTQDRLVNMNTATLEELDALPGIGSNLAQQIIDYRTKYGSFLSLYELLEVPGIGEELLEQIWPYITVGG